MAVEAIKSTVITNADATPAVLNVAQIADGRVRYKVGVAAVDAAASIGSTYRLARIKSNDLVSSLLLDCTAITAAAADIGLYKTAANGGAVADADLFASAQSLAAALAATNVTRESGVITVANMQKPVWELLGLAADPQIEYDIVATLTAAATAAGTLALSATVVGRT
ncbi:MAG: hypothetical protein ACYC5T_10010 [Thiobacillus sp.]